MLHATLQGDRKVLTEETLTHSTGRSSSCGLFSLGVLVDSGVFCGNVEERSPPGRSTRFTTVLDIYLGV